MILFVLGLLAVLVWAGKPPRMASLSMEETLQTLSFPTHASHLFPIMQALRPDDLEYLQRRGRPQLADRLRKERKKIGLNYLQTLRSEFDSLLAASRTLAVTSPELQAMEEFERVKLSIRFELLCRYVSIRLSLGLVPWNEFGGLSEMAGRIAMSLERATNAVVERATGGSEFDPLLLRGGRGDTQQP